MTETKSSLLSHLANRFVTQRENLATEALLFILSGSKVARGAFASVLKGAGATLPGRLWFRTQAAEADNAIPDLVGEDADGRQVLVVEAKFWAGLTGAQPTVYLQRLLGEPGGALVFIAPAKRMDVLWRELHRRCAGAEMGLSDLLVDTPTSRAARTRDGVLLSVVSWRSVLDRILGEVEAAGEVHVAADVRQLQALCDREDSEAFLPLESQELTGNAGQRQIQFTDLVHDLTQRAVSEGLADVSGLRATATRGWYGKYARIGACSCLVHYSAWKWGNLANTPIWLQVRDQNWSVSEAVNAQLAQRVAAVGEPGFATPHGFEFPLFLPIGVERPAVLDDLWEQLKRAIAHVQTVETGVPAESTGPPLEEGEVEDGLETPIGEGGPGKESGSA